MRIPYDDRIVQLLCYREARQVPRVAVVVDIFGVPTHRNSRLIADAVIYNVDLPERVDVDFEVGECLI